MIKIYFYSICQLGIEDNNNEKFNLNKVKPARQNNQQEASLKENLHPQYR